jgi:hypothetical protein
VRARVIMSPKHARRFLAAFERNFAMYEKKFGRVIAGPAGPPRGSEGGEVVH